MRASQTKNNLARAGNGSRSAVRASGGNVFEDMGLADADERLAKARLAHEICELLKRAKLTQAQAARKLGIDQPKVSALMRGRLRDFSTDRLIRFITLLDRDVWIVIREPKPIERGGCTGAGEA